MLHVETTISETSIRVRLADHADSATVTSWIDIQVPLAGLKHPTNSSPIAEPEEQFLGELRAAALVHARQVIDSEIRRLKNTG